LATRGAHAAATALGPQGIVGDLVGSQGIVDDLVGSYEVALSSFWKREDTDVKKLVREREIAELSYQTIDLPACRFLPPTRRIKYDGKAVDTFLYQHEQDYDKYANKFRPYGMDMQAHESYKWSNPLPAPHNPNVDSWYCGCVDCVKFSDTCVGPMRNYWDDVRIFPDSARKEAKNALKERWGSDPIDQGDLSKCHYTVLPAGAPRQGGFQCACAEFAVRMFEKELLSPDDERYAMAEQLTHLPPPGQSFKIYGNGKNPSKFMEAYPVRAVHHVDKAREISVVVNNEEFKVPVDDTTGLVTAKCKGDWTAEWQHRVYTGELHKPAGVRSKKFNSRFAPIVLAATLLGAVADAFVFTLTDFDRVDYPTFISQQQHMGQEVSGGARSIEEFRTRIYSETCGVEEHINYSAYAGQVEPPIMDFANALYGLFDHLGSNARLRGARALATDYYDECAHQAEDIGFFNTVMMIFIMAFAGIIAFNLMVSICSVILYFLCKIKNAAYGLWMGFMYYTYATYLFFFQCSFSELWHFRLRSKTWYVVRDAVERKDQGIRIAPDRLIEMSCPNSELEPVNSVDDKLVVSEILFYVADSSATANKKRWMDPSVMQYLSSGSVVKNVMFDGTVEFLLTGSAHGTQYATHFSAKNSHGKFGVQRWEPLPTRLVRTPHAHDDDTDVSLWRVNQGQMARASGLGLPTLSPATMCCQDNNAWITPEGCGNILHITNIVDGKIMKSHGRALERITNNWNHGAHSATTVPGTSGAGLYIVKDGKYYWAGIHLGSRQSLQANYFALSEGIQPYLRDRLYDSDELDSTYNPDSLMATVMHESLKVTQEMGGGLHGSKGRGAGKMYRYGGHEGGEAKAARLARSRYIAGTEHEGRTVFDRAELEIMVRKLLSETKKEGLDFVPPVPTQDFSEFEEQFIAAANTLSAVELALQAALAAPRSSKKKASDAQLALEAERIERARAEKADRKAAMEAEMAANAAAKAERKAEAERLEAAAKEKRDAARAAAEEILKQRITAAKEKLEASAKDYYKRIVALMKIRSPDAKIEAEVIRSEMKSHIHMFIDILEKEGGFVTREKLDTQLHDSGWLVSLLENETICPMLLEVLAESPDHYTTHDEEPNVKHVAFQEPSQVSAGSRLAEATKPALMREMVVQTEICDEEPVQAPLPQQPMLGYGWQQPNPYGWAQMHPQAVYAYYQNMIGHSYPGYHQGPTSTGPVSQEVLSPTNTQPSGLPSQCEENTQKTTDTTKLSQQLPPDSQGKEGKSVRKGFGRGSPPGSQPSRQPTIAPTSRRQQQRNPSPKTTLKEESAGAGKSLQQPSKTQLSASAKLLGLQDTAGLSPELQDAISRVDTKVWKALTQSLDSSLKSGTHCFVNRLTAPPARGSPIPSSQEEIQTEVSSSVTQKP